MAASRPFRELPAISLLMPVVITAVLGMPDGSPRAADDRQVLVSDGSEGVQ